MDPIVGYLLITKLNTFVHVNKLMIYFALYSPLESRCMKKLT